MTFNEQDPNVSARKHRPAITAILVALVAAALAFVIFSWMSGSDDTGATGELAPATSTTEAAPTSGEPAATTESAVTEPAAVETSSDDAGSTTPATN